MKKKGGNIPSIFDGKKIGSRTWRENVFVILILVLVCLFLVRFLNLTLIWHLNKLELKSGQQEGSGNCVFLGLGNQEKAKKRLLNYCDTHSREISVVAFYNLSYPTIFFINNKGKKSFVDLGRLVVFVGSGFTSVSLLPSDIIIRKWKNTIQSRFFGESLMSFLFDGISRHMSAGSKSGLKVGPRISYVLKPLEKSRYLKIAYMLYFYLPLFFIFYFSSLYGRAGYSAFFYYIGLFFLFNFKKILVTVPFFWLIDLFNGEDPEVVIFVAALFLLALFLSAGFIGLMSWKKNDINPKVKPFIFFFILLPLFLRF
jgi:hypothetical protein